MKISCDLSVTSARHRPAGTSTPWFTPWNSPVSGTIPGLVLDFSDGSYGAAGALGPIGSTLAFSRASDATRTDASGLSELVGPNVARIDHDTTSFAPIGMLLEETKTNIALQSDAPADQTITVAAVDHVISFYGTGTVTLSGVHAGTVVGTGAYPVRTQFSFSPTGGDLTLTVSGSVTSLQLEAGDAASTYVPTGAAISVRENDIATVPLGPWFNPTEGTLVFEGSLDGAKANDRIIEIDGGASTTRLSILWNTVLSKPQFQVWQAGVLQAAIAPGGGAVGIGSPFRVAITFKANEFGVSLNGGPISKDNSGTLSSGLTTLRIGRSVSGAQGLMLAERIVYYPTRLSDAEVVALSA